MQIKEPQRVGHRRPATPDLERNIFLSHSKFASQSRVALGFFDWVEIGALQVFDQRKFEDLQIVCSSDDSRHRGKTELLRSAPPTLACDQFKSRAGLANNERLNNSVLPNRLD